MRGIAKKFLAAFCLVLSILFAGLSIFSPILNPSPTYAVGEDEDLTPPDSTPDPAESPLVDSPDDIPDLTPTNPDETPTEENPDEASAEDADSANEDGEDEEENTVKCTDQAGSLSWIVCPATEFIGSFVDGVYGAITDLLVVDPITTDAGSPIYIIWQYARSLTNIVFVIFLIIVIISQITGLGINNYGVKRILPRLIIAVILVNLSYLICALAVDLSNIIGSSLCDFLEGIQSDILTATAGTSTINVSFATVVSAIITGGTIAGLGIGLAGGAGYVFFMVLILALGGAISVISGFVTLAARQALVALLVMIAPLAFVAYLLPNTEKWFEQWKNLLFRMLIFYPMFSFLYGASRLVGFALIASATEPFAVILGLGVQVFPLFFSWSLMKMSGTILNAINTGVRKAASPLQKSLTGWAGERAEHKRQTYFANSSNASARLRTYLDTRRALRELETKNASDIRKDRATSRALIKASSITGRDENGFITYSKKPNHYTRTAKSASYYHTAAGSANTTLQNIVSKYGDQFKDESSQYISRQSGEIYAEAFSRQLEAQNLAEADQVWLLDKFLNAVNTKERDSYEFNRLIGDAHGSLGANGEAAIMGQVIQENVNIENRRRTQARVIATKFGVSKTDFRGMVFDKAHIDDNGFETDADGHVIENEMYQLIEYDKNGKPTKYKREQWQQYIGVHKKTGDRITKDQYDALSDTERKDYNRVRYMTIRNDKGDPVQYVYETDAGYMKELLGDDIAIGDPINHRYASEIGVGTAPHEKTGIMRRYHSTISKNLELYKEHDATVTPMVTAQIDRGFVTSKGQLNIARLQSLAVATKPGRLLQSDGIVIKGLANLIGSVDNDELFDMYFPDADVDSYRTVNGVHLDGWRLAVDENGQEYWQEINHNNPNITVDDKKNFIKHKLLPKVANKLVGMINKTITYGVSDNMKPDGLQSLLGMQDTLANLAKNYDGEDVNFEDLFVIHSDDHNKTTSIYESPDPNALKGRVRATQKELGIDPITGSRNPYRRNGIEQIHQRNARREEAELRYIRRNSYDTINETVSGWFDYVNDYDSLADLLNDYVSETECLREHQREIQDMIDQYRFDPRSGSADEVIHDMSHRKELEAKRIAELRQELEDFLKNNIRYEG